MFFLLICLFRSDASLSQPNIKLNVVFFFCFFCCISKNANKSFRFIHLFHTSIRNWNRKHLFLHFFFWLGLIFVRIKEHEYLFDFIFFHFFHCNNHCTNFRYVNAILNWWTKIYNLIHYKFEHMNRRANFFANEFTKSQLLPPPQKKTYTHTHKSSSNKRITQNHILKQNKKWKPKPKQLKCTNQIVNVYKHIMKISNTKSINK